MCPSVPLLKKKLEFSIFINHISARRGVLFQYYCLFSLYHHTRTDSEMSANLP